MHHGGGAGLRRDWAGECRARSRYSALILTLIWVFPAAASSSTVIEQNLTLNDSPCAIEIAADSLLTLCQDETTIVRANYSCAPGFSPMSAPEWFLDGVLIGTGLEVRLSADEGMHSLMATCGSCQDQVQIDMVDCPMRPRLDALFSRDESEATVGIFLAPNPLIVTPFNFAWASLSMRPFTLQGPESPGAGRVILDDSGSGFLQFFTPAGSQLTLPHAFALSELPVEILVNATSFGVAMVSASYAPAAGGKSRGEDAVRVRCEPFPGLTGNAAVGYPYFHFANTFNSGGGMQSALDPVRHDERAGLPYDAYVVEHRTPSQWGGNRELVDVTGAVESASVIPGSIRDNVVEIWPAGLDAGDLVSTSYDLVYDFGRDGRLDPGDLIDGLSPFGAGAYAVRDLVQPGPYPTAEAYAEGGAWLREVIYYPTNIAQLGSVPLVILSHGNGHSYTWYEYLGRHLASYGYIFMSHSNNSLPGSESAATTTLSNTDYFLGNLETIAGGELLGHVDGHRITWIGHSVGGEGVVRAYDRLYDGEWVPDHFTAGDVVLVSSIAPVCGLPPDLDDTHDCAYHILAGGADGDICACPDCPACQYFRLTDRARGIAQTTYVHGASHNDFNCCGVADGTGPDLIGRQRAQGLAQSYYLVLEETYAKGNPAAKEFLTRMYDDLHPSGIASEVEVSTSYREALSSERIVIDDFQTGPSPLVSSSGGAVRFNVTNVYEGFNDDNNDTYSWSVLDPMNGMTYHAGDWDESRGVVFDYTVGRSYFMEFDVVPGMRDVRSMGCLSLRACQGTRHPETVAHNGPLSFALTLRDGGGKSSTVRFGSWGALPPLYLREGFGPGAGWINEMNTVRIPLASFVADGCGVDLSDIVVVRLDFGTAFGSERGRIGLDDLQFVRE